MTTTWRCLLTEAARQNGESFDQLTTTLTPAEADETFDESLGEYGGVPFTAWSDRFVYFPVGYDGAREVGAVPRHPCRTRTKPVGGG